MTPDHELDVVDPEKYKTGTTQWFEGEPAFVELVTRLQEDGKLDRSPYNLPLPYLSVSAVEQYLKCPRQFYFRYVLGLKRPPGIALVQGSTIHKAVELGYGHVISQASRPPLEFCLDTYASELDARLTDEVVWDDDEDEAIPKDKGRVKDQGVSLMKQWYEMKLPNVNPQKVEATFVTSFGKIPVVGRIDLIDSEVVASGGLNPEFDIVVDNKVLARTPPKALVDAKMQLSVYAHATGISRQRLDLFIKTKTPKIGELMTSRSPKDVRWAVKMFVEVAKAISAGSFPMCSPESYACTERFCGYWSSCRGAD